MPSWPASLASVRELLTQTTSGNRRLVEEQLTAAGLDVRGRFVVESTPTALALAREGVGAAILPATMNSGAMATELVEVKLTNPVLYRSIALVRRRAETLMPPALALHDAIRRIMPSTLSRE